MYNMTTYLGEQLLNAAFNIMPTHETVLQLTREVQGPFTGKLEFFFYRAFIANTEIIKLSLFNIVPC